MDPLTARDHGAERPDRLRILGRAHVTAREHDEHDRAAAILEDAA
jgi:hypothetical protein